MTVVSVVAMGIVPKRRIQSQLYHWATFGKPLKDSKWSELYSDILFATVGEDATVFALKRSKPCKNQRSRPQSDWNIWRKVSASKII